MWRALFTEPGGKARELKKPEEIAELRGKGSLWLDLFQPAESEVALLTNVFRLDPLVVADCVHETHHPKVDDYGNYVYLAAHGVRAGVSRGEIETLELDVVFSEHWLITHRHHDMRSVSATWERALRQEGFLGRGPADVLQGILSEQSSHYIEEVEKLEEEVLTIEDILFRPDASRQMKRLFEVKADIARLRRILGAQRELLHRLSRGDFKQIAERLLMHYRDVYDHIYRATEMLDMLRDISMAAMETHLSVVANRTNEIMKVLTILSTFILPLTLITGWYGMNFEHMHAIRSPYGEAFVLGLFVLVTGTLALYLRKRKWL